MEYARSGKNKLFFQCFLSEQFYVPDAMIFRPVHERGFILTQDTGIGGAFRWSIHITDVFERCNFTKYDPSSFGAEAQEKISIL